MRAVDNIVIVNNPITKRLSKCTFRISNNLLHKINSSQLGSQTLSLVHYHRAKHQTHHQKHQQFNYLFFELELNTISYNLLVYVVKQPFCCFIFYLFIFIGLC